MKNILIGRRPEEMVVANDEIFDDEGLILRLSEIKALKKSNESLYRSKNEEIERMNVEIRWLAQCYSATKSFVA